MGPLSGQGDIGNRSYLLDASVQQTVSPNVPAWTLWTQHEPDHVLHL